MGCVRIIHRSKDGLEKTIASFLRHQESSDCSPSYEEFVKDVKGEQDAGNGDKTTPRGSAVRTLVSASPPLLSVDELDFEWPKRVNVDDNAPKCARV